MEPAEAPEDEMAGVWPCWEEGRGLKALVTSQPSSPILLSL